MNKIKNLLFIPFVLVFLNSFAQDHAYSVKLIEKFQKTIKENQLRVKENSGHRVCITNILREAWRNWDSLTPGAKRLLKAAAPGRPVLTGPELIFHSVYYDIHYTLSGSGAVSPLDVNPANGTPDYVDLMATVFDSVYLNDVNENYIMPPSDGMEGGSSKYDVYIDTVPQYVYGFCAPELLVGDNPNSPLIIESDAATSYMVMNNDFSWTPSTATSIRVTCAHEFFHAIQFGYESYDSQFLCEATAVWMEDHRYPGLDDDFQYIPEEFYYHDVALNWDDSDGSSNNPWIYIYYARWIYFKHLTENTSDDIIRKIFEYSIQNDDMVSIDKALSDYSGKNFQNHFADYLIANFLLFNNPSYPRYSYSRANDYKNYLSSNPPNIPGVKMEGAINYVGTDIVFNSSQDGNGRLQRLSADYISISASENCWISLIPGDPDGSMDLMLVVRDVMGNIKILPSTKSEIGNSFNINDTIVADYSDITAIVFKNDFRTRSIGSEQYQLIVNKNLPKVVTAVYPNPVSDELKVNIALGSREITIEMWDMFGRVFSDFNILSTVYNSIDVKHLPAGMYYLIIKEKDKVILNQKIIIAR